MTPLTDAQQELAEAVSVAVLQIVMDVFGRVWSADPAPPSDSPEEVQRNRAAYVLPIAQGAHLALMRFLWITAPPGSTPEQLAAHMIGNLGPLVREVSTDDIEAGHYWTGEHMAKAVAEARKGMN